MRIEKPSELRDMNTTRSAAGTAHGDAAKSRKIALVEDDPDAADAAMQWLTSAGFDATHFDSSLKFKADPDALSYRLYILDWSMPDGSGIEILGWLRGNGVTAPILFCTARDAEQDVVEALTSGADDYLVKPVRKNILLGRVHAALRRIDPDALHPMTIEQAPYSIDLRARTISVNGQPVELQPREFEVAKLFFQSPNSVLTREHITMCVWGTEVIETARSLDTHVARIRRLLDLTPANGVRLRTVYGVGYRMDTLSVTDDEI